MTGRDGTDGQTDIGTDRLFSENIILDGSSINNRTFQGRIFGNQDKRFEQLKDLVLQLTSILHKTAINNIKEMLHVYNSQQD